ncbi:hypothetical protein PG984_011933 [Apiospora sp. TS-2023a]
MPAITIVLPEATPTPEPSPEPTQLIAFHNGTIAAEDFLAAFGLNKDWVQVGKAVAVMAMMSFIVLFIFLMARCCASVNKSGREDIERKEKERRTAAQRSSSNAQSRGGASQNNGSSGQNGGSSSQPPPPSYQQSAQA